MKFVRQRQSGGHSVQHWDVAVDQVRLRRAAPRTTHTPRHSSSSDVYRCGCNPDDRSSIFGTGDNM